MRNEPASQVIRPKPFKRLSAHLSRRLVWYLVASYVVSAIVPRLGLWLRDCTLGTVRIAGAEQELSVPTLLLGIMLFNAAVATDVRNLGKTFTHPRLLLLALLANIAIPVTFVALLGLGISLWHDAEQARGIIAGLAILASMPIAASSTTWVQQAGGDIALSLGMVLMSTAMSPVVAPLVFSLSAHVLPASLTVDVHGLSNNDTQLFLFVAVVAPCAIGLLVHQLLSARLLERLLPALKFISKLCLLFLNYCNGVVALPRLLHTPAWKYLCIVLLIATALCALRFFGGYWLGKSMQAPTSRVTTTMFALGMNNNGSGLTLAAQEFPQQASILLTIVAYNLTQVIAAGVAHHLRVGRNVKV